MGGPAEKIKVSIVDASGTSLSSEPLSFKPDPPKTGAAIMELIAIAYGSGLLLDVDGDAVTRTEQVKAGNYEYRVTGSANLGGAPGHMTITPDEARRLVRQAGLTDEDRTEMLLLINTEADVTLPVFVGLEEGEVKSVVQLYLQRRRRAGSANLGGAPAGPANPGGVPADPAVQLYWQQLQRARVEKGFLVLADGALFGGMPEWGSRIYLRSSYATLWARIKELLAEGCRRIVITGTPGIGKTAFQFPLMHYLVREGVASTIVVQSQDACWLFSSAPGSTVREGSRKDFEAELRDPRTWWIVDMEQPFYRHAVTLLLSSPKKERYHEFTKLPGTRTLYLDVWTDEEISTVRKELFSHLTEEQVSQLQHNWGNIPRYVLEKANDKVAQLSLDAAIDTCSWDNIFRCIRDPDSAVEASHKLVHLRATGGHLHDSIVATMASPYVVDKMAERTGVAHVQHLRELLMTNLGESPYQAAAGRFFESFAHRAIQACIGTQGTFKATVRRLSPPGGQEEVLEISITATRYFTKLEDIKQEGAGVYCIPLSPNFPAIDALEQPGPQHPGRLYQMTTHQKTEVHADGLRRAVKSLKRKPGQPPRFYFVVPGPMGQSGVGLFGTYEAVPGMKGVEQWVMEVPVEARLDSEKGTSSSPPVSEPQVPAPLPQPKVGMAAGEGVSSSSSSPAEQAGDVEASNSEDA